MRFFYPNVNIDKLDIDEYSKLQAELDYLVAVGIIKLDYAE